MWNIYLDVLHDKALGIKAFQRNVEERVQQPNPELHLLDKQEREAMLLSSPFGPGASVKGAPYARYYAEHELALVGLSGPIFRRADSMDTSDAQSTEGLMRTVRALSSGKVTTRELKRDADGYPIGYDEKADLPVTKVLFTIDGPGGEATQMDEAALLIHNLRDVGITTVGFAEGLMASAHYYLASGMQHLFASNLSLTGSVGVVMGIPIPAAKDAEGRNIVETPSGKRYVEFVNSESNMKRADPTSEEGMAYYQELVNQNAAKFIADVARFRNIPSATATEQLGHGRVFSASQAQERNLVDDIGTFDEVFDAMTDGSLVAAGRSMVGAGAPA